MKTRFQPRRLSYCLSIVLVGVLPAIAVGQVVFQEDFDGGGFPPPGWIAENYLPTSPIVWDVNPVFGEANLTDGSSMAAMIDPVSYRQQDYDAALISPTVVLPAGQSGLQLSFVTVFEPWSGDEFAEIDISIDGGIEWTQLESWNVLESVDGMIAIPLESYLGQSVRFRFRMSNGDHRAWDNYWQIDDVLVSVAQEVSLPGDLSVDGYVDIIDLNIILICWGQTGPAISDVRADCNGDGFVDLIDLNTVLIDWGKGTPPGP